MHTCHVYHAVFSQNALRAVSTHDQEGFLCLEYAVGAAFLRPVRGLWWPVCEARPAQRVPSMASV